MPVAVTKNIFIKDKDNKVIMLTPTDEISEQTEVHMKCDSQRCANRHDGKITEIHWDTETMQKDPNALPDGFYRLISLVLDPRQQKTLVFCSAQCARDYLQEEYVAPLSPKQEAALYAQNRQAEINKGRSPINVIPFGAAAHPQPTGGLAVEGTPLAEVSEPYVDPETSGLPVIEVPPLEESYKTDGFNPDADVETPYV